MRVTVCDDAVVNDDGTYSVNRGGKHVRWSVTLPGLFTKALLVEAEVGELPKGRTFSVSVAMSGVECEIVVPTTVGVGAIPQGSDHYVAVVPVQAKIRGYGTLRIEVTVDTVMAAVDVVVQPRENTTN